MSGEEIFNEGYLEQDNDELQRMQRYVISQGKFYKLDIPQLYATMLILQKETFSVSERQV